MLDLHDYPGLQLLTAHWRDIAAECRPLDRHDRLHISRANKTHEEVGREVIAGGRNGWVDAWARGWFNYGLCLHDQFPLPTPPVTTALLRRMRGIKVAALALFEPGTILIPHRHDELRDSYGIFHLGLEVADVGVSLWTASDGFIAECAGYGFAFDGYDLHYAFNASVHDRLILAIEFHRELMRQPLR